MAEDSGSALGNLARQLGLVGGHAQALGQSAPSLLEQQQANSWLAARGQAFTTVTTTSSTGFWPEARRLPPLDFNNDQEYAAILVDSRGRTHSVNNHPAIKYSDGREIYYWHGVEVPEFVVKEPGKITLEHIKLITNTEVRRVLIDKYGASKYLKDCGAKKVHYDTFGELYRLKVKGDEDMVMVKVKNSTPEPDGSIKDYWLRVPPQTKTAQEGVAWTFGMQEKQYKPQQET